LRDDAATKRCLAQLLLALSDQAEPTMTSSYGPHQQSLLP
jgi:CCR4-NOT transcription complex subunit 9